MHGSSDQRRRDDSHLVHSGGATGRRFCSQRGCYVPHRIAPGSLQCAGRDRFHRCTGSGVLSARLEANDLGERTDVADVDS